MHSPVYVDQPMVPAPPPKSRGRPQSFQPGASRRARVSEEPLRLHHNQHTKKREQGAGVIASVSASVSTAAPSSDRAGHDTVGSPAASTGSGGQQERGNGSGRRAAASPSLERAVAGASNGNGNGNNGVGKRRVFKRQAGTLDPIIYSSLALRSLINTVPLGIRMENSPDPQVPPPRAGLKRKPVQDADWHPPGVPLSARQPQPPPHHPDSEPGEGGDEALYCFCQRVSFGEMIGCDNNDCATEWVGRFLSFSSHTSR
jgi:hypothetical protein